MHKLLQRNDNSRPEPNHPASSAVPPRYMRAAHGASNINTLENACTNEKKGYSNLATFGSRLYVIAPLCSVVLTAVKRHAPQHICPQGVMVAF